MRLKDVAAYAGVSMKTVSNVVHDYTHVSEEMRTKVQSAIDELGYRPNVTARRLATGKTGMLALAIPEVDQFYFAELARHVGDAVRELGYRVIVERTINDIDAERAVIRDREEGLVDGVIFHPTRIGTEELGRLLPATPLVLLGESARPDGLDHVMIDNIQAAVDGVDLLVRRGRRRIAFLASVADDYTETTELRLNGYRRGLQAAGLPFDPSLVISSDGFFLENGVAALNDAMSRGVLFDAVLCRDETFGLAAIRSLASNGVSVPRDVAVLSWDDTAIARASTPALSSVSPDKKAIATEALKLLIDRIEGFDGPGRHRIAPHTVVDRDTT
ncbi:regulatory protein LacI [Microbacterium laevaniformans OR221]|nr:regulatory protein LacI [Microbacterium laevaniformans OR221]